MTLLDRIGWSAGEIVMKPKGEKYGWVAGDFKGDVSGHEFHGNRYTGGIGGEKPPSLWLPEGLDRQALTRYTLGGYGAINGTLRGTETYRDDENDDWINAVQYIEALDGLMTPTTDDQTVFRGITDRGVAVLLGLPITEADSTSFDQTVSDRIAELVGGTIEDKGFISTSHSDKIATGRLGYDGSGHVEFEIHIPAGTKALEVNARLGGHAYANEEELILEHGTKFNIDSVSEKRVDRPLMGREGYVTHVLHLSVAS